MRPRVLVLLAAYNGEKYIREQIESVLAQEGDFDLTLRVRDDGSSDGTVRVVEALAGEHPGRIELIRGGNVGYNANFFTLLDGASGYDLYALCDHDDKWLPGKIDAAVKALKEVSGPALYCSPSIMTDEELRPIGMTRLQKRPFTLENTLIQNICPGHNQVLNPELLAIVQRPRDVSRIYVYDLWIANLAALFGQIVFDSEARTLYRQHGTNELGSSGSGLGKLLKAGRRAFAGEGEKNKKQMAYFAEMFRPELEKLGLAGPVRELLGADRFGKRLKFVCHCPFIRQSRLETLAFRLAVLSGRY